MHRIRFRIHYRVRGGAGIALALALLPVACTLLAIAVHRAHAAGASSPLLQRVAPKPRQFYATKALHTANEAPTACAPGYHFASLWEIVDPSSLRYNTTFGRTSPDSGHGPPVAIPFFAVSLSIRGWVRTGFVADTSSVAGEANCDAWTSASDLYSGTVVSLPPNWTGGGPDIGVWSADTSACDTPRWVWCVQDSGPLRVFLPLVLRE
jgi:hypothetical protein